MTFSSASLSACEVDEVAATAAGVMGLRAATDGGRGGAPSGVAGPACAVRTGAAVVLLSALFGAAGVIADVVTGMTWRAIGRGFGSGILGAASTEPDSIVASARHVAKAVDRNAAARTVRVTAFLRGESFKADQPQSYLIEYVDKILTDPCGSARSLRQFRGKIAAINDGTGPLRAFRGDFRPDMNCVSVQLARASVGGSPWQPRQNSGDRSLLWSRPSRMARSTRRRSARW